MAKCAATTCTKMVKPEMLMCLPHWRMVPTAIQREVNRTWRDVRHNRDAYTVAREKAVAAVDKEASPPGGLFG